MIKIAYRRHEATQTYKHYNDSQSVAVTDLVHQVLRVLHRDALVGVAVRHVVPAALQSPERDHPFFGLADVAVAVVVVRVVWFGLVWCGVIYRSVDHIASWCIVAQWYRVKETARKSRAADC
jgi:hypothetical protein